MNKYQLEGLEYYSTCLWHLKDTSKLFKLSLQLFKDNPNSYQTWVVFGNCYSSFNDHLSAKKFFQRSIQINDSISYIYCLLGHEHLMLEDYEQAL